MMMLNDIASYPVAYAFVWVVIAVPVAASST